MTADGPPTRGNRRWWLPGTAAFAMLWVVARACNQSITMDEALSYSNLAAWPGPSHWDPNANHHLLNTMLMGIFTAVFGPSHLTVRAGAVIGAAVYIASAYCLCRLIGAGSMLQWSLFVCLVYNPFVFDYMVAARGYGLAVAFLTCAIALAAGFHKRSGGAAFGPMATACGMASVCAGLSFVADLSFAFVDAAVMFSIFLWACAPAASNAGGRGSLRKCLKLAAACALPGLAVAAALAGPVVLHFPRSELVYGAESFRETLRSVYESSLYQLNPYVVNPLIYDSLARASGYLVPVVAVLIAWRVVAILANRSLPRDAHARWLLTLAAVAASALALAAAAHWIAFHFFRVLLPKERTALWIVTLVTLLAGLAAAFPVPTRAGRMSQRGLTAALFAVALYFTLCLRLTYFKEWQWDAGVDKTYAVLSYYNHTCGLKEAVVDWRYYASLNFYRSVSGREDLAKFSGSEAYPPGKPAYVFYYPAGHDLIDQRHLKVVYRGDAGAAIAIDPAMAPSCETDLPREGIRR